MKRLFAFGHRPALRIRHPALLHGSPAIPHYTPRSRANRIINEIGLERIRAKSTRQTERLIECQRSRI